MRMRYYRSRFVPRTGDYVLWHSRDEGEIPAKIFFIPESGSHTVFINLPGDSGLPRIVYSENLEPLTEKEYFKELLSYKRKS